MNNSNRYYDSSGSSDDIRPGKISSELRRALNIAENDLPIWIYRMRALGYPPGWLNKAIVDTDDIFDTDSAFSEGSSNKREHQEIQYDHSKLIEYPGFNTPMPPNCVDYHYYINMPPMLDHQQLEYAKKRMISHTDASNSPKRARMGSPPTPEPSTSQTSHSHNKKAPEVITISDEEEEDDKNTTNPDCSTSLANQKSDNEVQPVGHNDNNLSGKEVNSVNKIEDTSTKEAESALKEKEEASVDKEKEKSTNIEAKEENKGKPMNPPSIISPLTEGIKLVSRGTPMPKRVNRAPLEKFSEGVVGELLYFENTPSSSGKFDSIKGLLNDIRKSKPGSNSSNNKSF